ncbi:MAG: SDR family NAD(P)-dependent oxidoreductase [Myxococcota bacterium]|nr:SDR family NAD(P)-dependent oxidoreductase [Myxococcota bacterium]
MRFRNKIVWITGAGSGIGRALAVELARNRAVIVLSGRRREKLESVLAEIQSLDAQGYVLPCDVTRKEELQDAIDEIERRYKKLDIVIANAGFSVGGRVEDLTQEDWRRQFDVNVFGLAQTARCALPSLARSGGQIVLVGSVAAFIYAEKSAAYCASKAAVHAIGETLSLELIGTGVTCTTIHPGYVESDISRTDNRGTLIPEKKDRRPQKLLWKSDDAARAMLRAIASKKRVYVFTYHGKFGAFIGRVFPNMLFLLRWFLMRKRKRRISDQREQGDN